MEYEFNECQSSLEELKIYDQPQEIQEQFFDYINNVPFIQWMISKDRPHAKDLPRDEKGRIIFDVVHPPILDNMDYFREAAISYKTNGVYSQLRPNPNPNSEFKKYWDKVLDRSWNYMLRESDGMWIPGDMYFYLNFDPIIQTKIKKGSKRGERVVDFPECWDGVLFRYFYIYQAQNGGLYDKRGGLHGCEISSRGKAHPYSQEVYTPEGLKLWKDIKIGDTLFGDDGKTTKVVDIPFDGICDVYEITFKDGRKVKASGNHLWKVWRRYSHCFKTMSTKEMLQDFCKKRKPSDRNKGVEFIYAVPSNSGVDWEFRQTKIDPYTMGLCLGDGCFRTEKLQNNVYYTSSEEDMCTYLKCVPYDIAKIKTEKGYFIRIPNVKNILQQWGLHMKKSEDKYIPEEYKFNSREVRFNILKGLMDSDGFVDSNGVPIIGVPSKQLADDITFIARSLGYNCLQSVKKAGYKVNGEYKECLDNYIVRIYTSDRIFNLERKYKLISKYESRYSRSNKDFSTIVDIKKLKDERCKCVTVDNESHCYLIGDFVTTHNSKSYSTCSMMAKRFVIGESKEVSRQVKCLATAYQKQYLTTDGILNKFQAQIDFLAQNTPFPNKRLKSSLQDMAWTMGYVDLNTGTRRGTLNEVSGLSAKDDPGKVRGKRQNLIIVEEFGSFGNVLEMYNIMRPSVEEGDYSFGQMYLIGTAGEDESDFQGAQEIVYNPKGYKMYALPNVYDKLGQGRKEITYFFPGYLSRKGCYDENGNSNVTKALLEILIDRYTIKYNSSDINSITRAIAEIPITPQEAITRTRGNMFPVTLLNERINEIDNNPTEFDTVYTGMLQQKGDGSVEFIPTTDVPIREFPTKDNKVKGCIEIFEMPQKDKAGNVFQNRYILGHDPVDNDGANTMSLSSTFVLDLFTDKIVAEYTGRQDYADDNFEIVRLLCLFYNGKCLYENNKRGIFAYFSSRRCLHLLADTPDYLVDKQLIKFKGYGNSSKGVAATKPINDYANTLVREWLIKPVTITVMEDGEEVEKIVPNLHFIRNRALLKELVLYNPDINVDRLRSLGMVMLYRGQFVDMFEGNLSRAGQQEPVEEDDYFKHYDEMIKVYEKDFN